MESSDPYFSPSKTESSLRHVFHLHSPHVLPLYGINNARLSIKLVLCLIPDSSPMKHHVQTPAKLLKHQPHLQPKLAHHPSTHIPEPVMTTLPGLSLSAPQESLPQVSVLRTQDLPAGSEYRFEVSFSRILGVKLLSGTAELFGTELAPNAKDPYTFSGTKGAIYTWHGCKLELSGEAESEYTAEETQMMSYANAHFALENVRERAKAVGQMGPRVLVVGPENAGKTSVVRILTAYVVKAGRQPVVVNLDPRQGMLSVPGSLTATSFASILDVEEGWGSSPISGPSPVPVKMPLVYHYGLASPEEGRTFRPLVTRMALAVTSRLEEDAEARTAGCIIDTPGAISHGKGGVYENIQHIISEFSGAYIRDVCPLFLTSLVQKYNLK